MERLLQFGTGRFLRGFVEAFVDDHERVRAREGLPPARRVTAVETSGSGMASRLAAQGCAYELRTCGLDGGRVVDTSRTIRVIDRTVDSSLDLESLTQASLDPEVMSIVSNTTEAGYARGAYPRRLASVLLARAREGMPGLVILPCELIEENGARLRALVAEELGSMAAGRGPQEHVLEANAWATTLVDRITVAPRPSSQGSTGLDVVVEPFASWVIQAEPHAPLIEHECVTRTGDVRPYALRKLRMLNGAHTALVTRTRGTRVRLVREALDDPSIAPWLEDLLLEEIMPTLVDRIVDGEAFAASVLERFRNPFLDHRLADIAVNHHQKVVLRLLPTYREHVERFGRPPARLEAVLRQEGVIE
jgi:tagaturonate reductase